MVGFTFDGFHCELDMKVRYAPTESERAGHFAKWDIDSADFDSKDGGVYYRTRKKPLEFELPCFYEEITAGERERIVRWLDRERHGRLIFDDRPWCYYDVVPSAPPEIREYPVRVGDETRFSGIQTINFTAYDGCGHQLKKTADAGEAYEQTGLLSASMMPMEPTVASTEFLVYNPGTERCGLILQVAGDGIDGTTVFHNEATNQTCTVMALSDTMTTDLQKWIELDGERQTTFLRSLSTSQIDYRFHDDGYISLAPADCEKGVQVSFTSGSGTIHGSGFRNNMTGRYIYLDGDWRLITFVRNSGELEVAYRAKDTGSVSTVIALLNRITVTKSEGVTQSKLAIDYNPKVR